MNEIEFKPCLLFLSCRISDNSFLSVWENVRAHWERVSGYIKWKGRGGGAGLDGGVRRGAGEGWLREREGQRQ